MNMVWLGYNFNDMAPPYRNPQPPYGEAPDIARAIEAMVVAWTQQSNNMM